VIGGAHPTFPAELLFIVYRRLMAAPWLAAQVLFHSDRQCNWHGFLICDIDHLVAWVRRALNSKGRKR
jgi:hypothetical protein